MVHYKLPAGMVPDKLMCAHKGATIKYFPAANLLRVGIAEMPQGPLPETLLETIPEEAQDKLPRSSSGVLGITILSK